MVIYYLSLIYGKGVRFRLLYRREELRVIQAIPFLCGLGLRAGNRV